MEFSQNLEHKQKDFQNAMYKYHNETFYQATYKVVSVLNVTLQVGLLFVLFTLAVPFVWILPIILIAYFLTDFINGLVHLYMDNNENYNSFVGAFIASFHLHHRTPQYKSNNLMFIYFNESGTKFWLVGYLILIFILWNAGLNDIVLAMLILIGVLSSFAEVSHYLCHNSNSKFVLFLQDIGLLLSMKHHKKHHNEDNNGYAFLNGMSDFFIDKIATTFYDGYKYNSDRHYEKYKEEDTANRI